jgi:hypothetical protein
MFRPVGRESATIFLGLASVAMGVTASFSTLLALSRKRRRALSIIAVAASVLYWVVFVLVAQVAGLLK